MKKHPFPECYCEHHLGLMTQEEYAYLLDITYWYECRVPEDGSWLIFVDPDGDGFDIYPDIELAPPGVLHVAAILLNMAKTGIRHYDASEIVYDRTGWDISYIPISLRRGNSVDGLYHA